MMLNATASPINPSRRSLNFRAISSQAATASMIDKSTSRVSKADQEELEIRSSRCFKYAGALLAATSRFGVRQRIDGGNLNNPYVVGSSLGLGCTSLR